MGSMTASSSPLITTKAPDAPVAVQLHPLVLLTISDYITRHISRQQSGPIVGAIIGQQNGRSFTLEHAYECKTIEQGGQVGVDADFFEERLQQYREVHQAPPLDLVGIFMLGPVQGPSTVHRDTVKRVQQITSTDSVILLLFHAEVVDELQGGKLPITLYESIREQEGGETEIRFRELTFEVETGDAEMIGVDFVAKGGGNATAIPQADKSATAGAVESSNKVKDKEKKTKGKGKAKDKDSEDLDTNGTAVSNTLGAEDDELIASLTAKANAIRMLNQRINLIRSYLATLPTNSLTDATSLEPPPESTNHILLRSIHSMLSRLPLLTPPPTNVSSISPTSPSATSSSNAADLEKQSVHLTSLLAQLSRSLTEAQSMGSKLHIVAREKSNKERAAGGAFVGSTGRGGSGGMLGRFDQDSDDNTLLAHETGVF